MKAYPFFFPWLQCLEQLVPPLGLIHVGAGDLHTNAYPFLAVPKLLVVEAEKSAHSQLLNHLHTHKDSSVIQAVVAHEILQLDFYKLNKSTESGLIPPNELVALWPNIRLQDTRKVQSTTIDTLLGGMSVDSTLFNWLIIDCIPAGNIIEGGKDSIEHWDVIQVRAIEDGANVISPSGLVSNLSEIRNMLEVKGLHLVAKVEENHPNIVRALFVRNKNLQLDNLKNIMKKVLLEQTVIQQYAESESKAKDDALSQYSILAQEKQIADGRIFELEDDNRRSSRKNASLLESLENIRTNQLKQDDVIVGLTRRLAEQEAQLAELEIKERNLNNALSNITVERDECCKLAEVLRKSNDAMTLELDEKALSIEQLAAENKRLSAQQSKLNDELVKAAAQLELIKEIFQQSIGD